MSQTSRAFSIAAALLLALLAGCDRADRVPFAAEDTDPNYARGRQFARQGRNQEALSAFLKVIAVRGDNAPESHLEAALIYQQHIKDPIAAIYHFRKYLELQGNSRQADLVRQRIDAAKREFARTLPAHPLEDASVRLGYLDQFDRLQRENDALKAEIAALRAGLPASPAASAVRGGFDIPTGVVSSNPPPKPVPADPTLSDTRPSLSTASPAAEPAPRTFIDTTGRSGSSAAGAVRQAGATGQGQPAASARRHVVQAGDTLSNISQRYYGNRSRWRDIYQANRDQLKSESDRLQIGMELRIP